MSEAGAFEKMVEPILAGAAPKQVRLAASRGALPLPRAALVQLWIGLRADEDEEVREQAAASLKDLAIDALHEVLADDACAPGVLDHFAEQAARDEALAEKIAFHRNTPGSAFTALATTGNAAVIDLVLTNQQRLLTEPLLLDRIAANPALRADQRGRILELIERVVRVQDRATGAAEGQAEPALAPEDAQLLDLDIGELFAASEIEGGEELLGSEDPEIRTAYQRVLTLNVAQKAVLAMRGGREERMILVRDTNQIVALAVLKNGRITEEDIEAISRLRNVQSEVLRQVAINRDWTKNYQVVLQLVRNPRTPPGVASNFVSRLNHHDLKVLVGNHDIPELIRRMAKRAVDLRASRGRKRF